jgi:hypothetical protein
MADKVDLKALSLDAIVRDVARQLHELRRDPLPDDPVIAFIGCEIELSVKATAEVGGGIRFHIFSAEAKAGGEAASKIKLTFGAAGVPLVMQVQAEGAAPIPKRQKNSQRQKKSRRYA